MDLAFPVIASPAGAQAIDPGGETAVARAASAAGIPIGLSSFASHPFESVVRKNPNALYQLYWVGTRDQITDRVERARAAGAKALILTIDRTFASRRDWGSPDIPPKIDLPTSFGTAPWASAARRGPCACCAAGCPT
jgi:isopentenyl diphosphate isomerase/L-lactate dehydrogenase-like FMN-dependent dehydrogenase